MKTHRERAERAASLLFTDPPPSKPWVDQSKRIIAQETYPAELVESARDALGQIECQRSHTMNNPGCTCIPCQVADDLREALAAYDDRHDSCTSSGRGGRSDT